MAGKQKPVILNDYRKEFDDEIEELIERNRQLEDDFDPMFIDGWTQVKKANAIAAVDDLLWAEQHRSTGLKKEDVYTTIGARPQPVPLEFQAIRVRAMDGTTNANISRDKAEYDRWKYEPAKWPDHFQPHGYGQPLGYTVHADGTLHRDDLQLFVVDARAARAREASIARRVAELENSPNTEQGVEITSTAEKRFETITT